MLKRIRTWFRGEKRARSPWDLQAPLLCWSKHDTWTIRDAVEGTLILGATGSGKSSGSGAFIARTMLAGGFGGLVMTAKEEEVHQWRYYCESTGRLDDLVMFGPRDPLRFNFLDYEARRKGEGAGHTENIVNVLTTVLDVVERGAGSSGGRESEPYWRQAAKQLIRNLVDLCLLSDGKVSVPRLHALVVSAPTSLDLVRSEEWRSQSECMRALSQADAGVTSEEQRQDLGVVADYWLQEYPGLSEKTRSVVVSVFSSMIDVLNRGMLRRLFCGETNLTPEVIADGKIVVLALPVKEYGEIGQIAQVLFKTAFMRAIERRDVQANPRPVFLWADEMQHFVTSRDAQFQATCRSARVATVLLTQNLSGCEAALGGGEKGRAETAALFGNCNTRLFHCNSDTQTNEWASRLIGRTVKAFASSSNSYGHGDLASSMLGLPLPMQGTAGLAEHLENELEPVAFSFLRTGGPDNAQLVDAVVYQNGRRFKSSGKNYAYVIFKQAP